MSELIIMSLVTAILGLGIIIFFSNVRFFRKGRMADAIHSYSNGQFLQARQILEKIIVEEPRNALAYWYSGKCSAELGETSRSFAELKKVIQIDNYQHSEGQLPDTEDFSEIGAHRTLRNLYQRAHHDSNVFSENQILMRLDPANPEYPLALARALIKKKEFSDRTLTFLQRALEIAPQNPVAMYLTALTYYKQERFDRATDWAEKALEVNPGLNEASYILGEIQYSQNRLESARDHLLKGRMSEQFQKSALYTLTRLYVSQGKFKEALEYAEGADKAPRSGIEASDLEWDAKYLHALVNEKLGKNKVAHTIYKTISDHKPDYRDVQEKVKSAKSNDEDRIKDFKTAKIDIFQSMAEQIVASLNLTFVKSEITEDANLNITARAKDIESSSYAIFLRRNIELIDDAQLELLKNYMDAVKVSRGIYISSGDFTANARTKAEKLKIKTVNGNNLEKLLKKSNG